MYKVIGGDGIEYGPVTVDQLRQWVREGRANAQTQVRPEDATNWQALCTVAELADVFNPPPAAPPAIAGPGGIYEGDYELDIFGCVNRAWNAMSANFWLMVGGVAIYLLIMGGISGCARLPIIGILFSLVSLVVSGPLIGGVYIFLLRLLRGQPAEIGDVFAGFKDNFGQLLLGYLIPAIIIGICMLPGIVAMAVPIVMMTHAKEASAGLVTIASFGFVLMLIPAVYLGVCWAFTLPLIADKRMDFWPAMQASRSQVSRHWWTLLGTLVVVGVINLAGFLVCCVGSFVSMPLAFATLLCAYESIFTPRTAQPGPGA